MGEQQGMDSEMGRKRLQFEAIRRLVDKELVLQAAKKNSFMTSDDEIRNVIVNMDVFHENGQFKKEKYLSLLEANRKTVGEFEQSIRDDLMIQKMVRSFGGAFQPTRIEVEKNKAISKMKTNVEFVRLDSEKLVKPKYISDADASEFAKNDANKTRIEEYYKINMAEFSGPEKV